jgi:hypothetical protein
MKKEMKMPEVFHERTKIFPGGPEVFQSEPKDISDQRKFDNMYFILIVRIILN